jgi:TRADD-N domain-containing protein
MLDEKQISVNQSPNDNVDYQGQRANGSTSQEAQGRIAKKEIEAIRNAPADNIQQVGAYNLNLNDMYCESIIKQANRSFWSALISASVGLVFFLSGAALLLFNKQDAGQLSLVTSLGAAVTAFVSGTSFYLYTQAMRHFEAFHLCLARTEIVLLENSICKQIEDPTKRDAAYASIVENIENLAVLITSYGQKSQGTTNK